MIFLPSCCIILSKMNSLMIFPSFFSLLSIIDILFSKVRLLFFIFDIFIHILFLNFSIFFKRLILNSIILFILFFSFFLEPIKILMIINFLRITITKNMISLINIFKLIFITLIEIRMIFLSK